MPQLRQRPNQSLKLTDAMTGSAHVYEIRPRRDHRGVDLISDALPFGRLWYGEPNAVTNAVGFAKFYSRSNDAVIRVYDETRNVIATARAQGRFQRVVKCRLAILQPFSGRFPLWR
jgi:hypothetical protein